MSWRLENTANHRRVHFLQACGLASLPTRPVNVKVLSDNKPINLKYDLSRLNCDRVRFPAQELYLRRKIKMGVVRAE